MPMLLKTPFNHVYLEVVYNGKKCFLYHFCFNKNAFYVKKYIVLVRFIRKMTFMMRKMFLFTLESVFIKWKCYITNQMRLF